MKAAIELRVEYDTHEDLRAALMTVFEQSLNGSTGAGAGSVGRGQAQYAWHRDDPPVEKETPCSPSA